MIKNYLLVALRNLKRNKAFSFINILGLALGMACSLLIMLWVKDERNIDKFNKNTKQLYAIYEKQYYDNTIQAAYDTPGILADELKKIFPEVQYASGFAMKSPSTFQVGDKIMKVRRTYYIYQLPRSAGFSNIYYYSTHKRNRSKKSIGSFSNTNCFLAIKRFYTTGIACIYNCSSHRMVGHAQMA